jgi:gas vesicle protein
MNRLRDAMSFLIGVGVGGMMGSLIALWMSPRSGEETRNELQKIIITLRTQAQDQVQDAVQRAQTLFPLPARLHPSQDEPAERETPYFS